MKVLSICGLIVSVSSCYKTDDTYYNDKVKQSVFNGSTLEYLESQTKYDSMLVVINRVPDLRDSLKLNNITLFAIDNNSFKNVLDQLNSIRTYNNKSSVYLKDLDVNHLDTLMTRYMFKGDFSSDKIKINSLGLDVKGIKYEYTMHVEYYDLDASGYVEGGTRRLVFSDTNNSLLFSNWVNTYTDNVDIVTNTGTVHPLISGHDFGFDEFIFRFN